MRYSHTRITTFENCPRKYKYQYLEKVTATLGDTIEAFMGSRVHDTLEKLYRDLMMTRLLSLEELAGYYEESWEKRWDDSIRVIRKEYTPEDYRKKGRKCVEDYYRRYHPFAQGRTIGIEERVSAALGEDRTLTGFIDRLVLLEGGTYEIHDYKTSGRLPPQEEVDNDRQLALYQLAVRTMWSDMKQVELVWHYLVFDRELRSARSPGQLEELEKEVNRLIDRIESTEEFAPKPSALCDWCEFKNICPVWKHEYVLRELTPEEFKEEDGVRLVDRYSAIQQEESRLRAEKETLKNALVDFCASFGYEVVYGTEQKIRVKKTTGLQFPSSREKRRKELEEIIRRSGRWDELSSLNVKKLEAALRQGSWPDELRERLRPFYLEEESVRLYSSRIKSEEK